MVITALLAITNKITAPIIEKNQNASANAALLEVMPDGKGFETLERPRLLSGIPDNYGTVLIECMSTHTANILYDTDIDFSELDLESSERLSPTDKTEYYFGIIKKELAPVIQRKGNTVFVSAEVAQDGHTYDEETEVYKNLLTKVNTWLMTRADAAFEVVCGIPVPVKGELRV
jgi:adenosylcobinamide kinase/adenosylcobinamide-phosphate guanylyltransferase